MRSRMRACISGGMPPALALTGNSAISSSSFSVLRVNSGLSTGGTARIAPNSTILPASLPLYWSMSFSLWMLTKTTSPVTGPLVDGDHGVACTISTAVSGVTMRAHVLSCCQPIPNSPQSSRCAFSRPILVSVSRVHSLAFLAFGEPVRRGPMPSISAEANSITCERFRPSSRMR